ncbi:MAG: tail fiber protein, partial [Endomicrobia bacterium]|nr:tail fiber protein [Endomicrobiia bacterium]
DEMQNTIIEAGIELNENDVTQLSQAFRILVERMATENLADINLSNLSSYGLAKIASVASIPPGMIICGGSIATAPEGYLICQGAAVSRITYAALFTTVGTLYGAGDGSTTFNLPDYRGYFLRGQGGNSAALNVAQGDAIRNMTGDLNASITDTGNSGFNLATGIFALANLGSQWRAAYAGSVVTANITGANFNASRQVPTATENRPLNRAVNYFIKY